MARDTESPAVAPLSHDPASSMDIISSRIVIGGLFQAVLVSNDRKIYYDIYKRRRTASYFIKGHVGKLKVATQQIMIAAMQTHYQVPLRHADWF